MTGKSSKRIVFRCDGNNKIGFGHLSRCMALAAELRRCNIQCSFVGNFDDKARLLLRMNKFYYLQRRRPFNFSVNDVERLWSVIKHKNLLGVIIDSYDLTKLYLNVLSKKCHIVLLDDFCVFKKYACSVILNFTVDAMKLPYQKQGDVLYLFGVRYLLVREAMRKARTFNRHRSLSDVNKILISMGASGSKAIYDYLSKVTRSLLKSRADMKVRVIMSHEDQYDINRLTEFKNVKILKLQKDLAVQMKWADVCLCGGGLTKYEAAFAGVPPLVLSLNKGQHQETVSFSKKKLCYNLGLFGHVNVKQCCDKILKIISSDRSLRSMRRKCSSYFKDNSTRMAAHEILKRLNEVA